MVLVNLASYLVETFIAMNVQRLVSVRREENSPVAKIQVIDG